MIEKLSAEKIEKPAVPEKPVEKPEAKAEQILANTEKPKEAPKPLEKSGEGNIVVASQAQSYQQKRAQAIDLILAEGLNEIYLKMKPEEQKAFKKKGEETVAKINLLLSKTKVKVSEIVNLIRRWLKLIPGVNKFFLEQEVKIKADKIMRLKNK